MGTYGKISECTSMYTWVKKLLPKSKGAPALYVKLCLSQREGKERFGIVRQPKDAVRVSTFQCNRLAAVYKRRLKAAGAKSR